MLRNSLEVVPTPERKVECTISGRSRRGGTEYVGEHLGDRRVACFLSLGKWSYLPTKNLRGDCGAASASSLHICMDLAEILAVPWLRWRSTRSPFGTEAAWIELNKKEMATVKKKGFAWWGSTYVLPKGQEDFVLSCQKCGKITSSNVNSNSVTTTRLL